MFTGFPNFCLFPFQLSDEEEHSACSRRCAHFFGHGVDCGDFEVGQAVAGRGDWLSLLDELALSDGPEFAALLRSRDAVRPAPAPHVRMRLEAWKKAYEGL